MSQLSNLVDKLMPKIIADDGARHLLRNSKDVDLVNTIMNGFHVAIENLRVEKQGGKKHG